MIRRLNDERGLALLSILMLTVVLMILTTLILDLSAKEAKMTGLRYRGAQSLFVAEGGAVSARSALMAFMGADPLNMATIDSSLSGTQLTNAWSNGNANGQDDFGILQYIVLDGQRFSWSPPPSPSWNSVTFYVNWALSYQHLKLQTTGPISNPLGSGSYSATVVITKRLAAHYSCTGGGSCYVWQLSGVQGLDSYQFNYSYTVTSDGTAADGRRRVVFSGDFSIIAQRQNFARYALFTNSMTDSFGTLIYFNRTGEFDGPVHTNGEFGFREFPKYGQQDPNSPCSLSRVQSTPVTSVSGRAWFYNNGSPVELAANENVVSGVRVDAPVQPDCTPSNQLDDGDNAAANFTRGVASIPLPSNQISQKGVSIGRDPSNTTSVSNNEIRNSIPELSKNANPVPNGIYVPVVDSNNNFVSDANEPMGGGIYVQGDLDSLTLSYSGNNAIYTLVQGSQTVTATVDRTAGTTTVNNTAWSSPQTRTFQGVPKGFQQPGNTNAGIIYVEGAVNSLSGTLGQNEQTTIAASGTLTISNNLLYQNPPVTSDPNSNPTNLLGVFSTQGIVIGTTTPNDVQIDAVLMAGVSGDAYNGGVSVANYSDAGVGSRGSVHLIGGVIEEIYPPFGTLNADGSRRSGYGRDFHFDRRMSRGYAPPYFPTTTMFQLVQGPQPLAGVKPAWRESSP